MTWPRRNLPRRTDDLRAVEHLIPQPWWSATTASSSWSVAAVLSDMPAPHENGFSTSAEALQKWHSYRMIVYPGDEREAGALVG